MQRKIESVLEAFAVGDAVGMPTEFMTRQQIADNFGLVNELISPELSFNHSNLMFAQVTDDTEQNIYLMNEYCSKKRIDPKETALCLLRWARETDAEGKRYIGPSSLKALKAIEEGFDMNKAGLGGTTCGGIMRTPSAVLCTGIKDKDSLINNVRNCLIPTHFTSTALEASMAYAFALMEALNGNDSTDSIIGAALEGASIGIEVAPYKICSASSLERIKYLRQVIPIFKSGSELLDFLYNIYGTGLESEDICPAVFGIFMYAKKDVWQAISLGASLGGDTDTVAALSGALCCAYSGVHNIPSVVLSAVIDANHLDFKALSSAVAPFWQQAMPLNDNS